MPRSPPLQEKHRFQCSFVVMQQDNYSYHILLSTRHCVRAPPGWKEVRSEPLIPPLHLLDGIFSFWRMVWEDLSSWIEEAPSNRANNTVIDGHGYHMTFKIASFEIQNNVTILLTQVMLFNPWTEFSSHSRQSDVRFWKCGLENRSWAEWKRRLSLIRRQSYGTNLISVLQQLAFEVLDWFFCRSEQGYPQDGRWNTQGQQDGFPCKAIKEAVLNVTVPTPSTAAEGALANRTQRRSRVQAKVDEVLTAEMLIAQLEKEKNRKEKVSQSKRPLQVNAENVPPKEADYRSEQQWRGRWSRYHRILPSRDQV